MLLRWGFKQALVESKNYNAERLLLGRFLVTFNAYINTVLYNIHRHQNPSLQ